MDTLTVTILAAINVNSVMATHSFYALFSFVFYVDDIAIRPRVFVAVAEVAVGAGAGVAAGFLLREWKGEPKARATAASGYGTCSCGRRCGSRGAGRWFARRRC